MGHDVLAGLLVVVGLAVAALHRPLSGFMMERGTQQTGASVPVWWGRGVVVVVGLGMVAIGLFVLISHG